MIKFEKNLEKPYFGAILGPFFPFWGKYEFLSKIHSYQFSSILVKYYCAKFQKKLMKRFEVTAVSDGHMD